MANASEMYKRFNRRSWRGLLVGAIAWLAGSGAALAQSYEAMSCDQLWYARNAIYADKGYCFDTDRAKQVFGPRCFPPYGKLSSSEAAQVDLIRQVERKKGCASSAGSSGGGPGGDYGQMSCGELWYARNAIFAAKGYCFKSARGRKAFGPGCFPPYGDLNARERRTVDTIKQWERRRGCQ